MIIKRTNMMGLPYTIEDMPDDTCKITTCKKSIIVKTDSGVISQSWYDWQMRGNYIQNAFPYLSADEREFILTGITPEEWAEIFKMANDNVKD